MNAVYETRSTGAAAAPTRSWRVLHVLDHSLPLHSGYTFRTESILRQQRAMGWETHHLTGPGQGPVSAQAERCGEWVFQRTTPSQGMLARLPVLRYGAWMRALESRLAAAVDALQPDILHAHSPVLDALPALRVGRARGLPVVYEVRAFWEDAAVDHGTAREWGPRYRLTRALETRALRRADAVVTICGGLRDDMLARGIDGHRITVVPNAVDVRQFAFAPSADVALGAEHGLTPGRTLGFAGSFYAYEGLDLLLEAMPEVLAACPGTKLLLVGGGPQEARLKALVAAMGLAASVIFTGRVPHDQVARYCSVMDVMVYPRIARRLTELVTPLKPLEAMAMGKPVLASDIGGHRELIQDGGNGNLFRAGSATALAHGVRRLFENAAARSALVREGRQFVERERNWPASVERYRAVYAAAAARARQRKGGET